MEGWYDSSEVGLGCILPDLTDHDIDEVTKNNSRDRRDYHHRCWHYHYRLSLIDYHYH